VRSELSEAVAVDAVQHYTPYGEPFGQAGTFQSPFAFTGEPVDGNGLVILRARYYNPALGVFPSLDPVEGMVRQTMSLNQYGYVAENPVNLTDPSGAYWWKLMVTPDHLHGQSRFDSYIPYAVQLFWAENPTGVPDPRQWAFGHLPTIDPDCMHSCSRDHFIHRKHTSWTIEKLEISTWQDFEDWLPNIRRNLYSFGIVSSSPLD
jgi:RHS repeat-associated protein